MEKLLESKVAAFAEKAPIIFPDDPASVVSGKKKDFFIIGERKEFLGMVLESALVASLPTEKVRTLSFNPPILSPASTVMDALRMFVSSSLQTLPVVEKRKLVGAVSVYSLLSRLDFSGVALEEVINRHPYSVAESLPVFDLREMMIRLRLPRAYVTDSAGNLMGVVTHSSFLQKPAFFKKDWRKVSEIMERGIISISPSDSVKSAVSGVCRRGMRAVAVVEGGKLVGSVSVRDLLHKYLELSQPLGEGISVEISGLGGLESFERAAINSMIFGHFKKIAKSIGEASAKIVFKKSKTQWEVSITVKPILHRGTQFRGKSIFHSAEAFDPLSAVSEALRTLQRTVRHG
jgi:CBS domain-containing protein